MNGEPRDDEFYVGYLPEAPARTARLVRRFVIAALLLGGGLAATLAASQGPFADKVFEWGRPRSFVGFVEEEPTPSLLVRRPGRAESEADAWSRYLLAKPGKWGSGEEVAGLDGHLVRLEGTLIYREDQTMVEVRPGTVAPIVSEAEGDAPEGTPQDLGVHTLVGEIVDSKCYLGVMSPGATKPHRACAARCISGGIPPVLLVRQPDGTAVYLLLLSAEGRPVNEQVLSMIAEPLEITGRVERHPDLLVLKSDPAGYRRLDP